MPLQWIRWRRDGVRFVQVERKRDQSWIQSLIADLHVDPERARSAGIEGDRSRKAPGMRDGNPDPVATRVETAADDRRAAGGWQHFDAIDRQTFHTKATNRRFGGKPAGKP